MQGTMYWVVFLVAVLQGIHLVSGQEEILNEQEFEALCRMINWAERGLKHIKVTKRVTQEALKIGVRYLEVAGEENAAELAEAQDYSCTKRMEDRKRNCGLYKTFWEEAQRVLNKGVDSGERPERKKNGLREHSAEIRKKAMEVADIYHEIEAKSPSGQVEKIEEQLNKALYGRTHTAEEIREREERSRVCGKTLPNPPNREDQSLAVDLLCLCAMHGSWNGREICCADCTTGRNSEEWNPESNSAHRWEFLKQKCAGVIPSYGSTGERLRDAKQNFMDAVTKITTRRGEQLSKLGEKQNNNVKDCGADTSKSQGICMLYGAVDGVNLPWMKTLESVEDRIGLLMQESQDKTSKLERIKELSQEIESLIKGDTGRGRQQGRQKRSVDTENSVPETPADPSDPTQSTTDTNRKKQGERKPISTGNGASKSYGGDEVDSYDSKCDGENSACSDSPAKPTVKSSKSAINCPLGLILLLV
ncbi:variant surface glycoprotein (VSG, atypical), putative [Trypanosoma brucei brucei TREU927]|uniref:Variant surface glycoprotein (VSG, atypical), putative n=1 Tax=Trypanosoma brucei brucei (strain 927/4 GUTat10.1) TaxID=185431 RepID=Q38CU4_TRYB2|nr:variant surface glycoprotein [Trypanosoma brucei brucei TREU927]EAN77376.1 variant surface glycoprotein (VSG, atypical), putative [Trypanosoma brucei brucei TREU927]